MYLIITVQEINALVISWTHCQLFFVIIQA